VSLSGEDEKSHQSKILEAIAVAACIISLRYAKRLATAQ